MTGKLILGILLYRSMSVYEIKKGLEQTVGFFSTFSFGSIHPAIKKLKAEGLVTARNRKENGRAKTVYTITDAGRDVFLQWLDTSIHPGKIQDDGLLRVFFLAELPPRRRYAILDEYIKRLRDQYRILQTVEEQALAHQAEIPPEQSCAFKCRVASVDYGKQFYAFTIEWYSRFIEQLEEEGDQL